MYKFFLRKDIKKLHIFIICILVFIYYINLGTNSAIRPKVAFANTCPAWGDAKTYSQVTPFPGCFSSTGLGFNTDGGNPSCGATPVACPGTNGNPKGNTCMYSINQNNCYTGWASQGFNPGGPGEPTCIYNQPNNTPVPCPPVYKVTAKVQDKNGKALSGIEIDVYDNGGSTRKYTTDNNGHVVVGSYSGDHFSFTAVSSLYTFNNNSYTGYVNTNSMCGSELGVPVGNTHPPDNTSPNPPCLFVATSNVKNTPTPSNSPPPNSQTFSGTVFIDTNKNGKIDNNEQGYKGQQAQVVLTKGGSNNIVQSQNSDGSGKYSFSGFGNGKWCVSLQNGKVPSGYTETAGTLPHDPTCVQFTGSNSTGTGDFGIVAVTGPTNTPTQSPTPTDSPTPTETPTPSPVPTFGISGNIYIDADDNQHYNPPTDSLFTKGTSIVVIKDNTGKEVDKFTNIKDGTYDTGTSTLTEGTYTVEYQSLPSGYYLSYPTNGSAPPTLKVVIGSKCTQSTNDAKCQNGNISGINFGINNTQAWIQSVCGDWRDDKGITTLIPASAACVGTSQPYAIITSNNVCTSPGIAFTSIANFGTDGGQASTNPYNWLVGTGQYSEQYKIVQPGGISTSFEYLYAKMQQSGITPTDLSKNICKTPSDCQLGNSTLTHGIYYYKGNLTLTTPDYTFLPNQDFVFLIDGTLTLAGKIHVPVGSTAMFSVKNDITVNSGVGEASSSSIAPDLEGFYSTDQAFNINGTPNTCTNGTPDNKLNIAGSVVVNAGLGGGGLQYTRNLCAQNVQCPVVTFTQRPDFLLNAPSFIRHSYHLWQEVAP